MEILLLRAPAMSPNLCHGWPFLALDSSSVHHWMVMFVARAHRSMVSSSDHANEQWSMTAASQAES